MDLIYSLYLHCIGKDQPTGVPVHWKYNQEKKRLIRKRLLPHYVSQGEMEFAVWKQYEMDCKCCRHFLNGGGQAYLGGKKCRPDFLCQTKNVIWLYNGCWIHQHSCHLNKRPDNQYSKDKRETDEEAISYYKSLGFQVFIKTECEWQEERKLPHIQKFIHERLEMPFSTQRLMTEQQLLSRIQNNEMFGILVADVSVKDEDYDAFAPFPPFFVHKELERKHLCPEMLARAEELELLKRPSKCLVSVMKQKQMYMVSPLAK